MAMRHDQLEEFEKKFVKQLMPRLIFLEASQYRQLSTSIHVAQGLQCLPLALHVNSETYIHTLATERRVYLSA